MYDQSLETKTLMQLQGQYKKKTDIPLESFYDQKRGFLRETAKSPAQPIYARTIRELD